MVLREEGLGILACGFIWWEGVESELSRSIRHQRAKMNNLELTSLHGVKVRWGKFNEID